MSLLFLIFVQLQVVKAQGEERVFVPIVGEEMTWEEIKEQMRAEGEIVIANWTYGGLAPKYWEPGFKRYVKEKYGVDTS